MEVLLTSPDWAFSEKIAPGRMAPVSLACVTHVGGAEEPKIDRSQQEAKLAIFYSASLFEPLFQQIPPYYRLGTAGKIRVENKFLKN